MRTTNARFEFVETEDTAVEPKSGYCQRFQTVSFMSIILNYVSDCMTKFILSRQDKGLGLESEFLEL